MQRDGQAKFQWKQYSTTMEEKQYRTRKGLELQYQEEEEIHHQKGELDPSVIVQKYKVDDQPVSLQHSLLPYAP